MSLNFILIGAAGYIAPRHLVAIKEMGGNLLAAYDVNDSVGIMDRYFPDAKFFTSFELLESFVGETRRAGTKIDYVAICSPNFMHRAHVEFAMRNGADAICEKPLVLNPSDLDQLAAVQKETGKKVYSILQLRLHPSIVAFREKIANGPKDKIYDVDLGYFTSRGAWYHASWKADEAKSGGIATNIGVHFYDMLSFIFGEVKSNTIHYRSADCSAGYIELEKAKVRWLLSINRHHLPDHTPEGQTTHRSITVEGEEIEFSGGFTELHNISYQNILDGNGFELEETRGAIELVSALRTAPIEIDKGDQHPALAKVMSW